MKLHTDWKPETYRITAYGEGWVTVNEERLTTSLAVAPDRLLRDWGPASLDELEARAGDAAGELGADIVLLGTGPTQRFPRMELLAELNARGVGVEVMSTPAACRTYNILMAEGRRVAALLLVG